MFRAPPPPPDRRPALAHLYDAVDSADDDFYRPTTEPLEGRGLSWMFQGMELSVRKMSFSQADPSNIKYYVKLGPLTNDIKYLMVYVLYPSRNVQANRAAFKRCLAELYHNPELVSSEKRA
ncbi:hypothetical protein V8D89_005207 [Ganoderma adspersum]